MRVVKKSKNNLKKIRQGKHILDDGKVLANNGN